VVAEGEVDKWGAVTAGYKQKKALYASSYPGVKAQVRPIVMDVFGSFATESWVELDRLVRIAAMRGGELDKTVYSALLQDLRWRLATTLAKAQFMVVDHLNWRLRTHIKLDSQLPVPSSASQATQTTGTGPDTGAGREKPSRRTLSTSVGDED
jgi:hypothetical protein